MRYLSLAEALELYSRIMEQSKRTIGVRDLNALESALIQPRMTFDGKELYPTIVEKASVLAYSIIRNHPFLDGNKRTGHAVMEVFLILNGFEIQAPVDEQEDIILQLASGSLDRDKLMQWLDTHIVKIERQIT